MTLPNLEPLILRYPAWFHAFRVTFTTALAMLIITFTQVPHGVWALITIIMVMGSVAYLGEVLSKAKQRIIGTLSGAALGLSLYLLPNSDMVLHTSLFLLMLATSIYFTRGKYSYAMLLCALTITLVATAGPGNLDVAWQRTFNVIWGALLAMLASRMLFPIRALHHFHVLNAEILQSAAKAYQAHLAHTQLRQTQLEQITNQQTSAAASVLLAELKTLLTKQISILPHAIKESGVKNEHFAKITEAHKRMLHSLQTLTETQWQQLAPACAAQLQLNQLMFTLASQLPRSMPAKVQAAMPLSSSSPQQTMTLGLIQQADIELLHCNNAMHLGQDIDINLAGYWWLNQELARRFYKLATELALVYQHPVAS
ncbi:MAG: FUSC family protein [Shewanella sp.]